MVWFVKHRNKKVSNLKGDSYPLEFESGGHKIRVFFQVDGSLDTIKHRRLSDLVVFALEEKFGAIWEPENLSLRREIAETLEQSMRRMTFSDLTRYAKARRKYLEGDSSALARLKNNFLLVLSYEFGIRKEVIDNLGKGNLERILYNLGKLEEKAKRLRAKKSPDKRSFVDYINEVYTRTFDEKGRLLEEGTDVTKVKEEDRRADDTSEVEVEKEGFFHSLWRRMRG